MSAQHTQGPWSGGNEIPIRAVDQEEFGFSICYINTDSVALKAEARANARLIAAAPELLEALKEALIGLAAVDGSNLAAAFAVKRAQAVITKATGAAA